MRTNILEYSEQSAARLPDKTAFSDGTESLTFGELYRAARAIGSSLIGLGLKREPVMIIMDRHPEQIAAFLGVVYAGCYYIPVDAEMPPKRIEMIAQTVMPRAVIYDEKNKTQASGIEGAQAVAYSELVSCGIDDAALKRVRSEQIDTDPIYIVFTSGSTGTPKGVVACHRSVIDYTESLCEALPFDENTVFGNQTPLFFDAPLKEIMPTLRNGSTTYLIPKKLFMFPVRLVEYLNTHRINTVCWVVSALTMISSLGTFDKIKPEYLTTVAFGSEVFPLKQLRIWRAALPDAVFFNLYGPTEATGMSCWYRMDRVPADGEPVPVGRPFRNTRIMLIGEDGSEVKSGEPGEIYIGGTCVTLGYYGDPDRTAGCFVQNPLVSPRLYRDIVYRTGDIARRNERGELIFISRRDYQIKHMGHRIELGEIEAAADSHPGISRSCCIYDDEKKKILLFYTGSVEPPELGIYLRDYLPRYMLPSTIKKLGILPLTPNGKLDRRALLLMPRE